MFSMDYRNLIRERMGKALLSIKFDDRQLRRPAHLQVMALASPS